MVTLHLAQLTFTHAQPSYTALDCIPAMQRRRLSPLAKLALNSELTFTHAQPSYTALDCIPAMQRRRLSPLAKLALNSALGALDGSKADYIVWVSRYGDESKTLNILQDVLSEQTPSPTQFSTSVHNAISGLYSILCQDDTPSTSLSCSWSEGLIEAYALLKSMKDIQRVLVVAYDEPLPQVYAEAVDFPAYAMAAVVTLEQPN